MVHSGQKKGKTRSVSVDLIKKLMNYNWRKNKKRYYSQVDEGKEGNNDEEGDWEERKEGEKKWRGKEELLEGHVNNL